jgi:hypothetical protein
MGHESVAESKCQVSTLGVREVRIGRVKLEEVNLKRSERDRLRNKVLRRRLRKISSIYPYVGTWDLNLREKRRENESERAYAA